MWVFACANQAELDVWLNIMEFVKDPHEYLDKRGLI